ncbi:MAG: hypothetical protein ACYSVY_13395, partial [Planctomycetota bacterium]
MTPGHLACQGAALRTVVAALVAIIAGAGVALPSASASQQRRGPKFLCVEPDSSTLLVLCEKS